MDEPLQKILAEHERRLTLLEAKFAQGDKPQSQTPARTFSFTDKKRSHHELMEELLKSEYCHHNNGLSFDMITEVFRDNNRPVDTKKLRDLLGIWKKRRKIDAVKADGGLRYFWIENEN